MTEHHTTPAGHNIRLALSWIIVLTPLAYGVIQTLRSALPLFRN